MIKLGENPEHTQDVLEGLHLPAILEMPGDPPGRARASYEEKDTWDTLVPATLIHILLALLLNLRFPPAFIQLCAGFWSISISMSISLQRPGNESYPRAENSISVWKRWIRSSRGHSDNLFDNTNVIIITFCCLHVCVILFMAEIQFQLNKTINFFWLLHQYK